ncbi:MAG: DNA repair protein RecN [Prolixibacteraceae bacterium]
MLTKLTVSNYALINELEVEFHRRLNSVTGETGAGKSIILGALGLIIGNRADLSVLENNREKCVVEGIFEIAGYDLGPFFTANDLDYDPFTILRREITPSGKSRAFINDTPVNLKVMHDLGLKLIDIHSQHQNLELTNQKFQLDLVDTVSASGKNLNEYRKTYTAFISLKKKLDDLKIKSEQAKADLDYFQFQFNQLEEADLQQEEQEELEAELEKLTHAEEIKGALVKVKELLDDERFSVIQNLKESQKLLDEIQEYISEVPQLAERMNSALIELKDILDETTALAESTEYDPSRIEVVTGRLNLIYNLQQKHQVTTVKELIDLKDSFDEKINRVTGFDEEISRLKTQLETERKKLEQQANELSALRKSSFEKTEKAVMKDLQQLGMPKAKFRIVHKTLPEFGPDGKDAVSFLFSANADRMPAEISKIASGGEMSRLMLAIKNLLRNSKTLPTVIFDEIDSGVSGEIALKMGNILKDFSASTQIINITHLPQIAAKGDEHFLVYKYEEDNKTYTSIKPLDNDKRVEELAKMVGGENISDTTIKTARELLNS